MLIASLIVTIVALVGCGWLLFHQRVDKCFTDRIRENVIVTLKAGHTFSGVLYEFDARSLVLVQAVEEQGQVVVDGELLLRWVDVAFVQKP